MKNNARRGAVGDEEQGTMKNKLRLVINVVMAAVVIVAWLHMFFAGGGVLEHDGISSLRFYTVLSNLLAGIAALIWVIAYVRDGVVPDWVEILKYIASVSVFLTFTIVIAFLGPLYGHENMYQNTNLWFHLIIPVVAVIEMAFLSDYRIKKRDNMIAIMPTILYGVVYVANNVFNGIGEWPDTNDWYGFLNWGYPVGIVIFICIGFVTHLLGRMIKFANNKKTKR